MNVETSKNIESSFRCIVRLITSYYKKGNDLFLTKQIRVLKRKCKGDYNPLIEIGPEEVIPKIINMNKCKDGVYELIICNESIDWETGFMDDWDYKLIQYDE